MASSPSVPGRPIEVFFSYAHRDAILRNALAAHLRLLEREGIIKGWHDRRLTGGTEWAGAIDKHLHTAQIILLLISADFLASDYCYDVELRLAIERHEAGEARVVPIILRPVDWYSAPFGTLQALPKDGRAVTLWTNKDEAFLDIARGIRSIAEELLGNPPPIPPGPPPPVPPSPDDRILALEKLLGFIPAYFDDLLSLVSGPKRFIAERLSRDELAMQKALVFLVVSIFISWGLQTPWIQSNPLAFPISEFSVCSCGFLVHPL